MTKQTTIWISRQVKPSRRRDNLTSSLILRPKSQYPSTNAHRNGDTVFARMCSGAFVPVDETPTGTRGKNQFNEELPSLNRDAVPEKRPEAGQ